MIPFLFKLHRCLEEALDSFGCFPVSSLIQMCPVTCVLLPVGLELHQRQFAGGGGGGTV